MMRLLLFIVLVLLNCFFVSAQSTFKGKVVDTNSKEAIPYATLAIYKDSLLTGGNSSDGNGEFTIEVKGEFTEVLISVMGYQPLRIPFSKVSFEQENLWSLEGDKKQLEELVVSGEKTSSQVLLDRKVIRLGTDLQQNGTTGLEAIDQIAEIQADLSTGSLSLRGSDNVRLLINGKPSSQNAGELLSQIPAAQIDRIELITSPPASESADGLSGIIDIILKKKQDKGLNLNLNTNAGTRRHGFGLEGNYNLSVINLRFSHSQNDNTSNSKQELNRFFNQGEQIRIFTPHNFSGSVNRYAAGADWFINPDNVLSLDFDYTEDTHNFDNKSSYSGTDISDFIYHRKSEHFHYIASWNANFKHNFSEKKGFIELDFNLNKNDNRYPAEDSISEVFVSSENYNQNNTLYAFSGDFSSGISELLTFESGVSWNARSLFSGFDFTNPVSFNTDGFDYKEDIIGIYSILKSNGIWNSEINNPVFNWQLGLRYEYFSSFSYQLQKTEKVERQFSNFFPSLHLSLLIKEHSSISLGYSRRVSRPDFGSVNPFRQGNQYFQFIGNPSLVPEFSDNVELSYNVGEGFVNWSFTSFFRERTDVIQRITSFRDNNIQEISFRNLGRYKSYGVEVNGSFDVIKDWELSFSGNYYHTRADSNFQFTWNNFHSSALQLKNTIKLNKILSFDLTYRYQPRRQDAFRFILPRNRLDFALRVKSFKDKLTLNLRVIDVFNKNLMNRVTVVEDFRQDEVWRFQSQTRSFLINASYKIFQNQTLIGRKKKL